MKIILLVALFALADPSAAFLAPIVAPQLRTASQVSPAGPSEIAGAEDFGM